MIPENIEKLKTSQYLTLLKITSQLILLNFLILIKPFKKTIQK